MQRAMGARGGVAGRSDLKIVQGERGRFLRCKLARDVPLVQSKSKGWRLFGERGGRGWFGGERRGPSTPPPAMRLWEAPLRMTDFIVVDNLWRPYIVDAGWRGAGLQPAIWGSAWGEVALGVEWRMGWRRCAVDRGICGVWGVFGWKTEEGSLRWRRRLACLVGGVLSLDATQRFCHSLRLTNRQSTHGCRGPMRMGILDTGVGRRAAIANRQRPQPGTAHFA